MKDLEIYAATPSRASQSIHGTMTVGEMKRRLEEFDDDLPIILSVSAEMSIYYGGVAPNDLEETETEGKS